MIAPNIWTEYVAAIEEFAATGNLWIEAERRADVALQERIAAADRELAEHQATISARQRELQRFLDQGHAHLRAVSLSELLPKRIPGHHLNTSPPSVGPESALQRIAGVASALADQRRNAERQRLEAEEAERRRRAEAASKEMHNNAIRTTLLKFSAGSIVALGAILSLRACIG